MISYWRRSSYSVAQKSVNRLGPATAGILSTPACQEPVMKAGMLTSSNSAFRCLNRSRCPVTIGKIDRSFSDALFSPMGVSKRSLEKRIGDSVFARMKCDWPYSLYSNAQARVECLGLVHVESRCPCSKIPRPDLHSPRLILTEYYCQASFHHSEGA